ncbi:MAG: GNAT family N-acetyltransferase, partial [Actinobacteria bacterium]|nr:GNAT family N-acetyltransferase [Actinomycetota bacterium]
MSDLAAVRPLRPADAGRVAELHLLAFPDYESSRLGRGYCRRLVLAYADRPDAWVLVAGRGEVIDGFLVGAPPSAQREVNAALLVPWGLLGALRSPARLWGRVGPAWSRLRRGRRPTPPAAAPATGAPASPASEPATVRVVLVGVDPLARGRGVGDALLAAFAERARAAGHRRADLSVATGNG